MKEARLTRQFLMVICCLVMALSSVGLRAVAALGDVLVIGVPDDRCPIFYRDEDRGEIVGIGVDLMRSASEAAGYEPSFRAVKETTMKEALDSDAYDVVMPFGSAITSTSGQSSIVSENLFQTPFTLVCIGEKELPQLKGLNVGMLRSMGGSIDTLHQLFPDMKIVTFETMDESVKALRKGEVDALLHNSYVWSYVLQKPAYHDLAVQPTAMFSMDFRVGTLDTPEGQAIIDRLNDGIATISDPLRQAVILDYTSRKLYRYDLSDYLYRYGLMIIMAVLLFIALIVITLQRIRAIRMEQEEKLRLMLDHDMLTGLLSMNGFRKRVEELLHTYPDTPYFLSYNNIRNFKYINDSLGRASGDELLSFWARKSMENLSDKEAIGRIEADHFAVLRRIDGEEKMEEDKENVFEPVQNFFINRGKENRIQICSGIYVLTPKDFRQIDVDHMLDLARVAERRTRDNIKIDHAFYNPDQWEKGKLIADVINYLPTALQNGSIQVWYQPQVNYETGEITGAEALCRWDHTRLGQLNPTDFISTLEDSGLIYDLDSYVWEQVCKDLSRWKEEGYHRYVSVNVSRNDIQKDRDIPGQFLRLIETYNLTPDQLRIEITESAFVEHPEYLISTTEKLRSYGFQVEMDDFGSGYSSLHMLKEVPVDRIKLDLHFLTASGDPDKCRIIVRYIIQMVHALGLDLIAEGVETAEQARFLQNLGCSEMQGYYYYKPMPVNEAERIAVKHLGPKPVWKETVSDDDPKDGEVSAATD